MGLFDFFKSKKECCEVKKTVDKVVIVAPLNGKVIPITEVPDETFASKMLGDGIAIDPSESGTIVAPVDGKIVQLFETGHAFAVETKEGINVLVHCGLNTVELKGQGFEILAKEGDTVTVGTPIVKFDLPFLKENCPSVITPVVILDSDEYKQINVFLNQTVHAGNEKVIEVEK